MCHICRTVDLFLERVLSAALSTYSDVHACGMSEGNAQQVTVSSNLEEKYRDENSDYSGCNPCRGDGRWRGRHPAPTTRLSAASTRQDAGWQGPDREDPCRQGARRVAALLAVLTQVSLNLTLIVES
jgi:hypothetical protein